MNAQEGRRGFVDLAIGATVILILALMATTVVAGDNSYRRVVKNLQFEYGATEDNLYGAGVMGQLAVALIRPAGVSNMTFTILRGIGQSGKSEKDFNQIVRSAVESQWRPLVVYSAPGEREWTHVYAQPDGSHIKVLVVARTRSDAVVVQARIDPDKLSAFIDDPQILGVPVGKHTHN
jgi:hypothetical protein